MTDDRDVARCFNRQFGASHNTVLVGGGAEPVYLPPRPRSAGIIRYTRNYAQSAIHEIAHWCIAGAARRNLVDYGYWYLPPPRSAAGQQAFFAAEARVQALECLFADAAGVPFHLSADAVHDGDTGDVVSNTTRAFAAKVEFHVGEWRVRPLPKRAGRMYRALVGVAFGE